MDSGAPSGPDSTESRFSRLEFKRCRYCTFIMMNGVFHYSVLSGIVYHYEFFTSRVGKKGWKTVCARVLETGKILMSPGIQMIKGLRVRLKEMGRETEPSD